MNTPQPKTMGLTQFVLRHNDVAQYDGADDGKSAKRKPGRGRSADNATLKVTKDELAQVNNNKVEANSQRARDGIQGSKRNTRSQSRNNNGRDIYDTDASNADHTSATGSTQLAKNSKPHQQHVSAKMQLQDRDDDVAVGPGFGQEDIPANAAHQDPNGGNPNALVQQTMQGDSYPSTTSGQPSEVDPNDNRATQQAHHAHSHHGQPITIGRGVVRGQVGMTAPRAHGPQATMPSQPNRVDEAIGSGFAFAKVSNSQPHANFSYAPGPRAPQTQGAPPPRMMPPNSQVQHHSSHHQAPVNRPEQEPHPAARHVTGEKPTNARPPDKRNPSQQPTQPLSETGHESDMSDDRNFMQPPGLKLHPLHDSGNTGYEQPPPSDPPAENEPQFPGSAYHNEMARRHYSDTAERGIVERYSEDAPPDDEPPPEGEPEFDYDPEDLLKMSYAQLKSQPFDVDPRGKKLEPALDSPTQSLHNKLATAIGLDAEGQAAFFETLGIDEWEEAGEWFLERFGDVVHAIKDSRREKRKLALEFEGKIDQRHEGVTKKQKLTQAALNEMKESGGKVLQGTPKRSRKSKK
ncbi:hypothetical protein CBER1_04792 [Cercospora berteroae]|uniref:Extracellular mutant protein 11 C-terminal domain-containing protein n=1 Tax=Cercospora berteroae TaxID=357750 RepID=A0A2S6CD29_9PEZI|nr:hypothetical protein CBER1_04792 [Cercospora berteroae]